jgi:hypothetical protein
MAEKPAKKRKHEKEEKQQQEEPVKQKEPTGLRALWLDAEHHRTRKVIEQTIKDIAESITDEELEPDENVFIDITERQSDNKDYRRCVTQIVRHDGLFCLFECNDLGSWLLCVSQKPFDQVNPDDLLPPKNELTRAWLAEKLK